jgi:hypothetical protein
MKLELTKMRKSVLLLLLAVAAGMADPQTPATKSAESWLTLVDAGKFGESWEQASPAFKAAITKEKWTEALTKVRDQVGKFESRKLSETQTIKDPPNAPPGDYTVLQYTSNFANKNDATEIVAVSLDDDKHWRTSGYFVK